MGNTKPWLKALAENPLIILTLVGILGTFVVGKIFDATRINIHNYDLPEAFAQKYVEDQKKIDFSKSRIEANLRMAEFHYSLIKEVSTNPDKKSLTASERVDYQNLASCLLFHSKGQNDLKTNAKFLDLSLSKEFDMKTTLNLIDVSYEIEKLLSNKIISSEKKCE